MTQQTVEVLEQEYKAAVAVRDEAQTRAQEAFTRLQHARLAATGLAGHLVRGRRWKSAPEYTLLVDKIGSWDNSEVSGPILKKDGSRGTRRVELKIAAVTDLGPYQPQAAS